MATRGRRESSYVASSLLLAGIFLSLWRPGTASAGSAMEGAKEKTESWANWVQDKVTEGLGLRHENARMAAEQIKVAAGNAADKISRVASDASEYATVKAGEVKDAVMDNPDAKAKMKDGANKVAGKAEKAYEGAKEKVKDTYEAVKEKAFQATGDTGAEMKQKVAGEL